MNRETYFGAQKFANKWSIGLAVSSSVVIIGIFGWGMVRQLAIGHPWGGNPNVRHSVSACRRHCYSFHAWSIGRIDPQ